MRIAASLADPGIAVNLRDNLGNLDARNIALVTDSVKAANGVSRAQLVERLQPVLPKGLEAITSDVAAAQQADQVKKSLSFLSTFLLAFATPCATRGGRRRPPPS